MILSYGMLPTEAGSGVTVAVVDSGIAPKHPALNVTGGLNMVFDETGGNPVAEDDWGPARTEGAHGTHVAGILGGHPTQGWRGVAPGVSVRSYRVIPHTGGGATNYDITKAIDRAGHDGCHIINLSLGGSLPDPAVRVYPGGAGRRGRRQRPPQQGGLPRRLADLGRCLGDGPKGQLPGRLDPDRRCYGTLRREGPGRLHRGVL